MQRKLLARLKRNPWRRGFSLVEVIFAASLLSLVMLMMFNLYPTSLLTIRQAEHRLQANALAQSVLESYRSAPFATASSPNAFALQPNVAVATNAFQPVMHAAGWPTPPEGSPSYGTDGVQYWTETTASPSTDGAGTVRLVDLKVTCYWDERSDHVGSWNVPPGYEKWHHLTQELYICDIQR